MQKFAFFPALIFFMAMSVRAEKNCSLFGMLFNDKFELTTHIIKDHPIRDTGILSTKSDATCMNLGLTAILMYDYLNRPISYIDLLPRHREVWQEIDYHLEIDFNNQTMVVGKDYYCKENFSNCGGALLLFALYARNYTGVKILLDKPEDLAHLDIVDKHGKNSLQLAEEITASFAFGCEDYEQWQEITAKLQSLYRFAQIRSFEQKSFLNPDFFWPSPTRPQEVEYIGWRNRSEEEAEDFINPQPLYHPSWWGHCHLWHAGQ